MSYCSKCGMILADGARFCNSCGQPVHQSDSTYGNERKSVYEGDLRKCPNCGAILEAFSSRCHFCGHEIRNSVNSNALKKFVEKYEMANTNEKRIGLIRTFAIPNTREDIMEFLILAASNVDYFDYFSEADEYGNEPKDLTDAWKAKFDQAYNKASILFQQGDRYLEKAQELAAQLDSQAKAFTKANKERNKQIRKEKKRAEKKGRDQSDVFMKWFFIGGTLLLIISFLFIWIFSGVIPNRKLEKLAKEVDECIENGEYDTALRKANQLIYDGDWSDELRDKWDQIRESYIQQIGIAKATDTGYAIIPKGTFKGRNYSSVEKQFKEAGFTKVYLEKVPDLVTGWLNDDGEVIEVLVDGSKAYSGGDRVDPNVEVIIKYHGFKD